MIENAIHGKDRPKTKRGLVVLLCVLLVIIVGLSIGVWVVSSNNQSSDEYETEVVDGQNLTDEEVENLIVEYQERIDTAASDEEKFSIYTERAYKLWQLMSIDGGDNYCDTLLGDLEEARKYMVDPDNEKLLDSLAFNCVSGGEVVNDVGSSWSEEQ